MTFLTPLIAGIAAAIAIPSLIILYFLKLRRRDLEVSTTLLWKKAIEDLQANAPFQKLRKNLLLFLQLLALAAALFAIAQPQIKSSAAPGGRHVILIDASASMQATDGDPDKPGSLTRLEQAKKDALELVDSLKEPGILGSEGDQAMVIAFDSAAHPLQNFTTSKVALKAAIESIEPTDSSTSIKEAIKLAKAYSPRQIVENVGLEAVGPPARIHIFSDGRLPDIGSTSDDPNAARTELTAQDQVVFHSVGSKEAWNVGITGIRAERAFDEPGKLSVFVGLQNTSLQPRTVDVELSIENTLVKVREARLPAAQMRTPDGSVPRPPVEKPPEEENTDADGKPRIIADNERQAAPAKPSLVPATGGIVFIIERTEGGIVAARLRSPEPDALPVDDIGYLSVPPAKKLSVALITPGHLFLREAVEGMALSKLAILTPAQGQAVLDDPKRAGEFDVFVLDRWLPTVKRQTPAGEESGPGLPTGRFLVFGAVPPPPMGLRDEGEAAESLVVDWRRDHPVMRSISFDALVVTKSHKITVPDDSPVVALAMGQHGPLLAEIRDQGTQALICTFDTLASNWCFDPGFVLFTAAGLFYLGYDGATAGEILRPGETLAERLPIDARNVGLSLPDNTRAPLVPTADGRVVYGPIRETGIYTLSWDGNAVGSDVTVGGKVRRAVAANLLDPQESHIASLEELSLPSKGEIKAEQEGAAGALRKLWPYLLLVALAVVLLEWWVYNRKVML
jgi:hypothetical protein